MSLRPDAGVLCFPWFQRLQLSMTDLPSLLNKSEALGAGYF